MTGDQLTAALAGRRETEGALIVKSQLLVEQYSRLRADLANAQQELRILRAESLAARTTGYLPGPADQELRQQRDRAIATSREAQAELSPCGT